MGQKKNYTEEFKREALRLLESNGKSVALIEHELGLSAGLLHHWRKRFQVNAASNSLELSEIAQLKLELREAKRELARVQMERDILKKNGGDLLAGRSQVKYAVIAEATCEYPISQKCQILWAC